MTPTRLALAFALCAGGANAQNGDTLPGHLYLDPGTLLGSTRVVALGGAYVGVAEGVEGMTSNLAAISHRSPTLDRRWDVDATASWLNIPLGTTQRFDFDNAGSANGAQATSQFLGALLFQYGPFGIGASFRLSSYSYCTTDCAAEDQLGVQFTRAALAVSVALHRDELLLAMGLYGVEADFGYQGDTWRYTGNGVIVDALYRPLGEPYRLGLSIKPQVVGPYQPKAGQPTFIAGRQLYASIVSPSIVSLGMSYRLGPGSENYNRLSPAARREAVAQGGRPLPLEPPPDAPNGRWLLTGQLDLVQGAENAVALRALINQTPAPVALSGMVEPRAGVEHETLPHRLRLRGGTYLEPSAYANVGLRPHLTGGLEVNVIHYLEDWSLSGAFDVAQRYYNVGLSIGFWR